MKSLSVVVPVYNAAATIADNIRTLDSYLGRHLPQARLIVVDDGSTDGTGQIVTSLALNRVELVRADRNLGKYGALKLGFSRVATEIAMFIDGDLPFELSALKYSFELLSGGFQVVLGDRTLAESESIVQRPWWRGSASWVFATLTRLILAGGIFDTQCGFKAFQSDVARELFRLVRTNGFSGDVELVYLALKYNLAMRRIPVRFVQDHPSSIKPLRDSIIMICQVCSIPVRWYRGRYDCVPLRRLGEQRYWLPE